MNIENIVGAKINGLKINQEKDYLKIVTDKGDFNFVTVGDCCSSSWIEHLNGVSNVIGGTVIEKPDLSPEMLTIEEKDDWDVFKNYQTAIKTDKGQLDIEFRNKSNGYYGGWITLGTDQYSGPIEEPADLIEVKNNF